MKRMKLTQLKTGKSYSSIVNYGEGFLDKEQKKLSEFIYNSGRDKMKIKVGESKKIIDGMHTGKIVGVEYRSKPLEYTDYIISTEGITIKASYPTNTTPETIHGRLLQRFGLPINAGAEVDPDELVGQECVFNTMNKTTPKGVFPEIMRDTLRPSITNQNTTPKAEEVR